MRDGIAAELAPAPRATHALAMTTSTVRRLRYDAFGGPEVLHLVSVPLADPGRGELRLRVKAAAVNPIDWKIRRGTMKWMSGSRFPKWVGGDAAGIVEEVGPGVTELAAGSRVAAVIGARGGAMGEAVIVKAADAVALPAAVTFEAAASAMVMATARVALRKAGLRAGQRLLVTGATGGVGPFVLQLARARGYRVTAVGSAAGVALARELGAETSLDYRTQTPEGPFDAIIDLGAAYTFAGAAALLTPRGRWVDPVPTPGRLIGQSLANLVRRRTYRPVITKLRRADLAAMVEALSRGTVTPVIAKTFPLEQAREAYRFAEAGRVIGRVLVTA
jgi:NADPH:quinone reductase-like Zn-dependent oxidoreductase